MVMIGGQPAARLGDMHVCPMLNPGVPPPPHVGGPIVKGSATVLIGSMPAARVGDQATCTGPPDVISMGCMTVLIGDGGGGAGGGAGMGGLVKASPLSAGTAGTILEDHYLHVDFVDKGGFPIVGVSYDITSPENEKSSGLLSGRVKQTGIKPGTYQIDIKAITTAKWSKTTAKVKDKVAMTAETVGIDSGEKATLEVWIKDSCFAHRRLKTFETTVQGDKIEGEWELLVDADYVKIQDEKLKAGGYSSPTFYFIALAAGLSRRSNLLEAVDEIEIKLKTKDGTPVGNRKYKLFLPSGEVREGTLDGDGYAKDSSVPPGRTHVAFDLKSGDWK
jgi:uncharacterized Zn-binding protein involved in type VI secretion